jgi:hypothetical protein
MGLLDDAIREHLDLKRRRGADPTEVERAEREALGPVRRGVEPAEEAGYQEDRPADAGLVGVEEPAWPEPLDHDAMSSAAPEALAPLAFEGSEPAAPPPPAAAPPPPAAAAPPPPIVAPPPAAATPPPVAAPPLPAAAPPPAAPPSSGPAHEDSSPPPAPEPAASPDQPEHAGGETVEYDVEHALDAEPAEDKEDVLEETPEFLQDTPDHDRLWFEQRPPRDFDFNG